MSAQRNRPPRVFTRGDVLALLVYLSISAVLDYLSLESELRTPAGPLVLLCAAGTATLCLWRRRPIVAFAVVLCLLLLTCAAGSGAEIALALIALYRAGAEFGSRRGWAALGVGALVACAGALITAFRVRLGPPVHGLALRVDWESWPTDWLSVSIVLIAAMLIASLLGINAGHRNRQVRAIMERAEQDVSIAAAGERERIAREMHDVIAHSLAVMIALADGAEATAAARPDESRRVMGRVAETGRRTLSEVKRLLTAVRDDSGAARPMPEPPTMRHLPALIEEFRAAALPLRLDQAGAPEADSAVGLTVYRIVQESLTNVLRHARDVRDVRVRLEFTEHEARIVVTDRSAEAPAAVGHGRGLVGIQERAMFYDGEVRSGARAGGGWQVFVRLSLEEQ